MGTVTRRPALAIPFALIGLVGGYLVGAMVFAPENEGSLSAFGAAVSGVTMITCLVLGFALSGMVTRRGHWSPTHVALYGILAGGINGALLGIIGGPIGMIVGFGVGLVAALPFIPPLLMVVRWWFRGGRARASSVVEASDARGLYALTACVLAVASLLPRLRERMTLPTRSAFHVWGYGYGWAHDSRWPLPLAVICCVVTVVIIAADIKALARVRGVLIQIDAQEFKPRSQTAMLVPSTGVIDLGLGTAAWDQVLTRTETYRERDLAREALRGDPQVAQDQLLLAVRFDRVVTFIASAVVVAHFIL